MKDIEIEIQTRVENTEDLQTFLQTKADFVSEQQQIDEYFVPAHRDFTKVKPIQEWFRLRSENSEYSMNYKKWHYNNEGVGQYADEYETQIDDLESARKIVDALDCKSIVLVDKKRKKWLYKDYEVAIDVVKGLGQFVEIEYKGNKEVNYKEVVADMVDFLKERNCGEIHVNNGGYPYLLLFPDEVRFISVAELLK